MLGTDVNLFDLVKMTPLTLSKGSFMAPEFRFNNERLRVARLYASDDVKVLFFDYSSTQGRVFVRFLKHWSGYDPDMYYEVQDNGESSGGGKWVFGIHNPWEKYIQENRLLLTKDKGTYIFGTSFEMLERVDDSETFNDEINRGYVSLPRDIRRFSYVIEIKDTGQVLVADHPAYKFNNYSDIRFRMIHCDKTDEEFEVINFGRYRDGGTTKVTLKGEDGVTHEFYYPNSLSEPKHTQIPTWDGRPMTRNEDTDKTQLKDFVVEFLGIMYDPHREL